MVSDLRARLGLVGIACVAIILLTPQLARAQATNGTLLGTVTDGTGAGVPGVTVNIVETRTNISSSTMSKESGFYTFPNLKDGLYRVEAELSGFKKAVRDKVQVDVNTTIRVDLKLDLGTLAETVEVSAESPALQTDRTDTGRVIQGDQIAAMPLGFGRNFQGMLATVPGASRPFRPHSEFFNSQDSLSTNVNGQSRLANNVLIEGIDDNHKTGLLTVLIPSAEALETVSVTTSNYDAELGRAGGAVTSVTLKSGTNQFKGSGYYFGNTDATQALNKFVDKSLPKERQKAKSAYHQVGFTFGGPIRRNRLFFFGDTVHTHDDLGRINRYVVPTEAMRKGDLSASTVPIFDPLTGDLASGANRTAFDNNQIPSFRISPIATKILANVPFPNITGAALGQVNYQDATMRERRTDAFDAKVNWQASQHDQVSARYSFQRPTVFEPGNYGIFGGPYQGGFIGTGTNLTFSSAGTWTRSWSNTLVMETRGGVSHYHNEALSAGSGLTTATEIGIVGANLDRYTSGMTQINVNQGWSNPIVGFSASLPWDRGETTVDLATTLTKVRGTHTIKFGGTYRHNKDFLLQTQDQGGPRGVFNFSASETGSPSVSASQSNPANSFAAFLLDRPSSAGRDLAVIPQPGTQHSAIFTFINDKWQASRNVTVDIGLRHEFYTPLVGVQKKGGLSNYDPATNTLRIAGYGDIPNNLGVKANFRNFNPRLGLSLRLNELTVTRAGYGVSTAPFPDNSYAFNFPVKQNNQFNAPNAFVTPVGVSMAAGFPPPLVTNIPSNGIIDAGSDSRLRNQSYFVIPTNLKEGLLHSWNVAFQRQLPGNLTVDIAYVGNRGQDVINRIDRNAGMVPGLNDAGRAQFAAFGRTASTTEFIPSKNKYNSMQLKVDRRFRNGFLITNSYTLGRGYTYNAGDDNGGINTPANIELSWGRQANDRKHTYVSSFVYNLPFHSDGPLRYLIGGWSVAGLFTAQSGTAVDITMSATTLRAPGNTQRPNMNGESKIIGDIGVGKLWFDTTVFSAPPDNTFGTLRRNGAGIDGPGFVNLDASLVKRVEVGKVSAEFRVDAFNVTDTLHANNPNGTFAGQTFGQINGSYGERLLRFGARVVF